MDPKQQFIRKITTDPYIHDDVIIVVDFPVMVTMQWICENFMEKVRELAPDIYKKTHWQTDKDTSKIIEELSILCAGVKFSRGKMAGTGSSALVAKMLDPEGIYANFVVADITNGEELGLYPFTGITYPCVIMKDEAIGEGKRMDLSALFDTLVRFLVEDLKWERRVAEKYCHKLVV